MGLLWQQAPVPAALDSCSCVLYAGDITHMACSAVWLQMRSSMSVSWVVTRKQPLRIACSAMYAQNCPCAAELASPSQARRQGDVDFVPGVHPRLQRSRCSCVLSTGCISPIAMLSTTICKVSVRLSGRRVPMRRASA